MDLPTHRRALVEAVSKRNDRPRRHGSQFANVGSPPLPTNKVRAKMRVPKATEIAFGGLSPIAAMSVRGQYGPPFDTRTHSASETTIIGWPHVQPSKSCPLAMSGERSEVCSRTNLLAGSTRTYCPRKPRSEKRPPQAIPGRTLATASPVVAWRQDPLLRYNTLNVVEGFRWSQSLINVLG